jgi:4-amino-4-deoxy-L-arabinose transferase-like glycosyltransferase
VTLDPHKRREAVLLSVLGLLWLSHVGANVFWLARDTRPPTYDMAGHASVTLRVANHIAAGELRPAARLLLVQNYPPLLYLTAAPLAIVGPPTIDTLTLVNLFFLALLMLATYGIARELVGPDYGLVAGALVSLYPLVYGLSRQLLVDFPLTTTVTLTVWLLLRAGRFDSSWRSLALGVALGFGVLSKTTFVSFVAAPLLIAAVRALKQPSRRRLLNLGLAAATPAVMAARWYLPNLSNQLRFIRFQAFAAAAEGDPQVSSLASWLYYLSAAGEVQIMLPLLVALLAAIVAVVLSRRLRSDWRVWMMLAWLAVPYVLVSLQPNKDPRYSMPLLPAAAVITALGLSTIRVRLVRLACVAVLGAWACVQFAGLTVGLQGRLFGSGPAPIVMRISNLVTLALYNERPYTLAPPLAENWQSHEVLRDLVEDASESGRRPTTRVIVLPDARFFEPNVFIYQALAGRLQGLEIDGVGGVLRPEDALERLQRADYVIAKSGDQGPAFAAPDAQAFTSQIREGRGELGGLFERVQLYRLPDRSKAFLFRRARHPQGAR